MSLLDHFHPPLTPRNSWEAIHSGWAALIAIALNRQVLPESYFAEEHTHSGGRFEIDVATFEDAPLPSSGGTATLAPAVWAPPAPAMVMSGIYPDSFEVRIYNDRGGARLVAAIELVSPSNKDRPEHRRVFTAKCANYLAQGVGLVVVDIVTGRQKNLHNELIHFLGQKAEFELDASVTLSVVSYRSVRRQEEEIEVWPFPLALGQPLPRVPLPLGEELCVPLDLEVTYTDICRGHRLS